VRLELGRETGTQEVTVVSADRRSFLKAPKYH
jgi:hypothetical protein